MIELTKYFEMSSGLDGFVPRLFKKKGSIVNRNSATVSIWSIDPSVLLGSHSSEDGVVSHSKATDTGEILGGISPDSTEYNGTSKYSAESDGENMSSTMSEVKTARACAMCAVSFVDTTSQHAHYRSQWHQSNLKRHRNYYYQ